MHYCFSLLADPKQAASCLKKAIDADKTVLKYHWDRCQLLEEMGDKQKTLQGFRRLLLCLGPQHGEEYLEVIIQIYRHSYIGKSIWRRKKFTLRKYTLKISMKSSHFISRVFRLFFFRFWLIQKKW